MGLRLKRWSQNLSNVMAGSGWPKKFQSIAFLKIQVLNLALSFYEKRAGPEQKLNSFTSGAPRPAGILATTPNDATVPSKKGRPT